jgi:hypothetical protein
MSKMRSALLICVAVTCAAACFAASASAEALFEARGGKYPAKIEANGKATISGEGFSLSCKTHLKTELSENVASVKLTPSYEECSGEVGGVKTSVTVTVKGCTYNLLEPKATSETEAQYKEFKGEAEIAGASCEIVAESKVPECRLVFGSQGPLKSVTYKDNLEKAAEETIEASSSVEGIKYKVSKCAALKEGEHKDGVLKESDAIPGFLWGGPGAEQSTAPILFGDIMTNTKMSATVVLKNTTGAARVIKAIRTMVTVGNAADVTYECPSLNPTFTVPANGSFTATLKFEPRAVETFIALIEFREETAPGVFATRWITATRGHGKP